MKNTIVLLTCLLSLSACANKNNPYGVNNEGKGFYSVSELPRALGSPISRAVKFCDSEKPVIISTSTENGVYSGKSYALLIFKCEPV